MSGRYFAEIEVATDAYDPGGMSEGFGRESIWVDDETGIIVGDKAKFERWLESLQPKVAELPIVTATPEAGSAWRLGDSVSLGVEGWAWRPPGIIAALPDERDHRYLIRWPNGEDGRWPESYLVAFSPADQWAAAHKLADESRHLRETIAGLLAVGTRVRYFGDGKPLLYGSGELTPGTAGTLVDASRDLQSALVRWDVTGDLTCWFGPTWTKPLSSLEYRPEDQPGHPYAQTSPHTPTEQDTTA